MVIFFLSKRAAFCSKYKFCFVNCYTFCPRSCCMGRIMKMYSNYFDRELWSGHFLVYQFNFYMSRPIRSGFLKFIFELEHFWDNSKINSILVRPLKSCKKMVVLQAKKIYYFNFMVSYLYAYNPHIGINENCKYLSHNNL